MQFPCMIGSDLQRKSLTEGTCTAEKGESLNAALRGELHDEDE